MKAEHIVSRLEKVAVLDYNRFFNALPSRVVRSKRNVFSEREGLTVSEFNGVLYAARSNSGDCYLIANARKVVANEYNKSKS